MWEHRIHALICIEVAGTKLPSHHRIINWLRDRGVDGPLVRVWRAASHANTFPVAITGTNSAFVRLHAERLGVFLSFVCMLIGTAAIGTRASADEVQPSTLKSCYGSTTDSISACTTAISSGKLNDADLAKAYLSRGLAQQRAKQDENAINDFNEALKINPSDPRTINIRGNSYLNLGQYDRAIEDYKRVIELNPKFVPAFFNIGLAYSAVRDFGHALDAYNQAIQLDPKNVSAINNRCYVNIMIGAYDAAIHDCSDAVQLDPNHINAFLGLGNAYALLAAKQEKGTDPTSNKEKTVADYNRAIAEYGRAIALNPAIVAAYIGRGHVFEATGDYAHALDDYDRAIQLDGRSATAFNNRCWVRAITGDLEGALSDCNASLRLFPNNKDALDSRGFAYLKMEKFDAAIADFSAALTLEPKLASSLYGRGLARLKKGDADGKADIEIAQQLSPSVAMDFHRQGL